MLSSSNKHTLNPDHWISNYYNYLFNYSRTRISDTYVIEEIIQETFFAGLKSMKNFKNKSSERTWLTAILKNKIVDYYRKCNSNKGVIERRMLSCEDYKERYNKELLDEVSINLGYYDQTQYDELQEKISSSLEKLPKRQARVFKMRIVDELKTEAVCEELNISRNHAWVLMARAKKNMIINLSK